MFHLRVLDYAFFHQVFQRVVFFMGSEPIRKNYFAFHNHYFHTYDFFSRCADNVAIKEKYILKSYFIVKKMVTPLT